MDGIYCKTIFFQFLSDMIKYGFHGSIAGILLGVGVNENFSRKDSAFSSWKNTYAGSKSLSSAFR